MGKCDKYSKREEEIKMGANTFTTQQHSTKDRQPQYSTKNQAQVRKSCSEYPPKDDADMSQDKRQAGNFTAAKTESHKDAGLDYADI